jgi:hypothetical protein
MVHVFVYVNENRAMKPIEIVLRSRGGGNNRGYIDILYKNI